LCSQFATASERRRDAVRAHVQLGSLFNGQHELNVQRHYERLLADNPRFAAFIKVRIFAN
jgi:RNA-splicing ligase RtcB